MSQQMPISFADLWPTWHFVEISGCTYLCVNILLTDEALKWETKFKYITHWNYYHTPHTHACIVYVYRIIFIFHFEKNAYSFPSPPRTKFIHDHIYTHTHLAKIQSLSLCENHRKPSTSYIYMNNIIRVSKWWVARNLI